MNSDVQLNRRFFFRKSVARIIDSVCNVCSKEDAHSSINEQKNEMNALWTDFTPEMIKLEADRLGIDPEDKAALFDRIQQEMLSAKS